MHVSEYWCANEFYVPFIVSMRCTAIMQVRQIVCGEGGAEYSHVTDRLESIGGFVTMDLERNDPLIF